MSNKNRLAAQLYLDHDKATLLDELSKQTRVPKQAYLREALDDLLVKYKMLKAPKPLRGK
jgi:predicted DNA-binding protein